MYPNSNLSDRVQRTSKKSILAFLVALAALSLLAFSAYAEEGENGEGGVVESSEATPSGADDLGVVAEIRGSEGDAQREMEPEEQSAKTEIPSESGVKESAAPVSGDAFEGVPLEEEDEGGEKAAPVKSPNANDDQSGSTGTTASEDVVIMGENGNHDISSWMKDFSAFIIPPEGAIPEDPQSATIEFLDTIGNNSTFRMLFQFVIEAPDGFALAEGDFVQFRYSADPPEYVTFGEFHNVPFFANQRQIGTFTIMKDEIANEMVLTLTFNSLVDTKTKVENCNIVTSNNNSFKTTEETTTTITVGDVTFTVVIPDPGPPAPDPGMLPYRPDIFKSAWVPNDFNGSQVDEYGNRIYKAWWTIESGGDLNDLLIQAKGKPDPALNITQYYIEDVITVGQGAKDIDTSSFGFVGAFPFITTIDGVDRAARHNYTSLGAIAFNFILVDQANSTYEEFKARVLAAPAQYGVYRHAVDADTPAAAPEFTVLVNFGSPTSAENMAPNSAYPKITQRMIENSAVASSYFKAKYPTLSGVDLETAIKGDPEVGKLVAALANNDIGGNIMHFRFTFLASYDQPSADEEYRKENKAIRYVTEEVKTGMGSTTFKKAAGFGELEKGRVYLQKSDLATDEPIKGASFKLMKYDDTLLDWVDYNHPLLVTDEWGVAVSDILENGRYKFVEVGAAFGYDPQSAVFDPAEFTVTEQDIQGIQVICTNEKAVSSLEVSKSVVDPDGVTADDEVYSFILMKNGTPAVDQAYKVVHADGTDSQTVTDSEGRFTLLADERAIFEGLAVGDVFTVEEVDRPTIDNASLATHHTVDGVTGADTVKTGNIAIFQDHVPNVVYTNAYTKIDEPKSLTVRKIADGNAAPDFDEVFTFVLVDDDNEPVAGQDYTVGGQPYQTTEDGIFTLHNEEAALFRDMPGHTDYYIWEVNVPLYPGIGVDIKNSLDGVVSPLPLISGVVTISETGGRAVTYTNTYNEELGDPEGLLKVTKQVDDPQGFTAVDKAFSFIIADEQNAPLANADYYLGGNLLQTGSDGVFDLTAGQTAEFPGLLLDTRYVVSELQSSRDVAGAEATTIVAVEDNAPTVGLSTAPIQLDESEEGTLVTFQNGYVAEAGPGMLSVVKYTAGNAVPKNAVFTFELTQGGIPVEGATYTVDSATKYMTGADGHFSLQANQVAVFSDLALDEQYVVKEIDLPSVAGVTVTTSNTVAGVTGSNDVTTDSFTVTGGSGVNVAYSNGYTEKPGSNPAKKSPSTGDLLIDIVLGVGALAGVGAMASFTYGARKRRQG